MRHNILLVAIVGALISLVTISAGLTKEDEIQSNFEQDFDDITNSQEDLLKALPVKRRSFDISFEDRALAICVGLCLYNDKKSMDRCFSRCRVQTGGRRRNKGRKADISSESEGGKPGPENAN